jgi:hypothetical protein
MEADDIPDVRLARPQRHIQHWVSSRADPVVVISQQPLVHFLLAVLAHFEYTFFPQCPHRE